MDLDSLYAVFKAKDARFDGRFFVGISSTGIYCRPVCCARKPKPENCTFYSTAAEAEQAGYRPCLLCRPELAPGSSIADATDILLKKAARVLEENCASGQSLEELAGRLGCTDRHLRRIFKEKYNVSPIQYLQTCRLLLAKSLLTDTNLSVMDVAIASGFGSLRRFNDLFKKHYKLSPSALRKHISKDNSPVENLNLLLCYRPPYRFKEMLLFLEKRAIPGVEVITDEEYMRTVHIVTACKKHIYGWIKVGNLPKKNALSVTLSESLLPALPQVLTKVRRLFDLNCDPYTVYEALSSMSNINPNLPILGIRLPGCFNPFEMAVRAVLGQQITVKAASTLAGRFVKAFGKEINTYIHGLSHTFPEPNDILALEGSIENHLGPLGIIKTRARTIHELAKVFNQSSVDFELFCNPKSEMEKLMQIPGIGSWTAQYIAMRTMEWTDAFLETDACIKKVLSFCSSKEMLELAQAWRPWRSYATINIWHSL